MPALHGFRQVGDDADPARAAQRAGGAAIADPVLRHVLLSPQRTPPYAGRISSALILLSGVIQRVYPLSTVQVGAVFGLLAGRAWGRRLLERWPGFFTLGRVSRQGVPKEIAENTNFELRLEGAGWAGQTIGQPDRRLGQLN